MGGVRTNLECRRIAAYVLNALVKEHRLGQKALVFIGDDFVLWDVRSDWEVFALDDTGHQVAEVYLTGDEATVVIVDWSRMIRRERLADYDPYQHGIEPDDRESMQGDPYPDGEYVIGFDVGDIVGWGLPEQRVPRAPSGRKPRVICSR